MHVLSGILRKQPFSKDLGDQKGFMWILELAEVNKDIQTSEKVYTNYKAFLFAKTVSHIKFNNDNLVQGAFVVVQCEKLKVDIYQKDANSPLRITLLTENARLADVMAPKLSQQQAPQQGGYAQQQQSSGFQQQAPQQGGYAQQQQSSGFQQQAPQKSGFSQPQQQAPAQQGGFSNQGQQQG